MPNPYPNPEPCYHEAGHAVVAVHHGLKLLYVTMEPPSDSGHFGQTATAPVVMDLTQLEIAMQVAAAGDIASSWFLPNREAEREGRTNEYLIRRFRAAARAEAESYPWYRNVDNLTFAKRGRERDAEIRSTGLDSGVGPEGWACFRAAISGAASRCHAASHAAAALGVAPHTATIAPMTSYFRAR